MKRIAGLGMAVVLAASLMAGCSGGSSQAAAQTETKGESGSQEYKIAYITEKLGDNAMNDDSYNGIKKFSEETGIEVSLIESTELQDHELNARNFAMEGYDLVIESSGTASALLAQVAAEFPDTHFMIAEGTITDMDNVTSVQFKVSEAAFLTGAFDALMNENLTGERKGAFVGGVRNPNLERAQYGFTAGCEYVDGECTVTYIGSFTDVAKGKEIALQLYNNKFKVIQAFAGGAGMGVYQAAESLGDGYYALGAADGQFHLSQSIIASQVKYQGEALYNSIKEFIDGKLPSGAVSLGIKDGAVGIRYSDTSKDVVPEEILNEIKTLEDSIVSGEIVPPSTEDEYAAFQK